MELLLPLDPEDKDRGQLPEPEESSVDGLLDWRGDLPSREQRRAGTSASRLPAPASLCQRAG